jgi:hypothetical protein
MGNNKVIGNVVVTLKWWYRFIPFFILKKILKTKNTVQPADENYII